MTTSTTTTARLSLTVAERQRILEEYDSYPRGDARRGALLRRYGLYTSQMSKWRDRLKRGAATLAAASTSVKTPAERQRAPPAFHCLGDIKDDRRGEAEWTSWTWRFPPF